MAEFNYSIAKLWKVISNVSWKLSQDFLSYKKLSNTKETNSIITSFMKKGYYFNTSTVLKVAKYGVIFGTYFSVLRWNTEIYRVNLHI